MTIDEHFIYMLLLEGGIFLLGILIVHMGQRKQTKLIEKIVYNPEYAAAVADNMFWGFMKGLKEDPVKEEVFFAVIAKLGNAAIQGIRNGGAAPKPVKLKGLARILEPFINNPDIQGMVADKVAGFVAKTGEAGAKQAVEGW